MEYLVRRSCFIISTLCLSWAVNSLVFAQSARIPSGVWSVGSLSPGKYENVIDPPGGLLLQLKGGLPITVTNNMITVRGGARGLISGSFTDKGIGAYTHSFKPDEPFPASDTIFVTLSGNISDVLGDFLDGNGNGIAEGSPDDDFSYWFIIGEINSSPTLQIPRDFNVSVHPIPVVQELKVTITSTIHSEYNVTVYNLYGKKVGMLYHGNLPPGVHRLTWDCSNMGKRCPAGTYFVAVQSSYSQKVIRAIVM